MRTWIPRALAALFVAAVAVSTLRAGAPEPPTATPEPTLTDVLNKLKDISDRMAALEALQAKVNLLDLKQDVQRDQVRSELDQLKEEIRVLKDQVQKQAATNISASINPNAPVAPTVPERGNILLDNQYPSAATVVVNGQSFRVMPFERLVVSAPVGPFSYEVFTDGFGLVQERTTRTLTATRDFPIVIHQ